MFRAAIESQRETPWQTRAWLTESRVDGFTTPEVAQFLASLREPAAAAHVATIETARAKKRAYLEAERRSPA